MDNESDPVDRELAAIEQRLNEWSPTAGGLDRDRLMFESGRASARAVSGRVPWIAIAIGMTAASIALGTLYLRERGERQALAVALEQSARQDFLVRGEPNQTAPRDAPSSPDSENGYLRIRDRILTQGLDAWPVVVTRNANQPVADHPRISLTPATAGRFLTDSHDL